MNGDYSIEWRHPDLLRAYPYNARVHEPEQVRQIADSLTEFGWTNPILIDGEDMVIAGHGRLMAARLLGMSRVPCLRLAGLSDEQRRAYVLADNKLAENAGWDNSLLRLELKDLSDAGFDVEVIGFSQDEIDNILNGLEGDGDGDGEKQEFTLTIASADEAEITALRRLFHLKASRNKIKAAEVLAMIPNS